MEMIRMPSKGTNDKNALNNADDSNDILKDDIRNLEEVEPLNQFKVSTVTKVGLWCQQRCLTTKYLKRRIPIISWLPHYCLDDFRGDLVAGTTVAITVIPQALALAQLANLPPQYGLYTAFMGCFMYTIFGSCKDLTIGPTAIMSLMTAEHVTTGGITYCILLTFLSGCIQLVMGLINLGFLVTFISSSVVSGFTSAAAITIATTQLGGIFGLKFKSEGFIEDVSHIISGIKNVQYWDMTMGLSSIVFLLLLKHYKEIKCSSCLPPRISSLLESFWWMIATARNALLVLICTGLAAVLLSYGIDAFTLTEEVDAGLPPFNPPSFSYSYFNNSTNKTINKDFLDIVEDLGSGLIVIPLLCILEAIAIAKSFAKGKKLDATQEMIALGICNIMGSFVSAYPATGSFSRTAINYSSGVRTTAGGIATGAIVLMALGVMSPYFHFIPKASLSALIFVAVLNMVHYKDVIVMWRTKRLDLLPFFATFIFSFIWGLEYGIMIGIGISLALLLLQEARPKIIIERKKTFEGVRYIYIRPDRSVLFPSSEYLVSKVSKSLLEQRDDEFVAVLIDCEHIMTADYSMAMGIKNMIDNFKDKNIYIVFINLKLSVQRIIKGAAPKEFFCFLSAEEAENFFEAVAIQKVMSAIPHGDDCEVVDNSKMGKIPTCNLEKITSCS